MANEAVRTQTSFVTVIASATTSNGAFDAGTKTAISSTSLTAAEETYALLDFHLDMTATSGTNVENNVIDLYRIPNANSASSPTPAGSYAPHYVGSFVIDNVATQDLYLFGVENVDSADTFITKNNSGATSNTYSINMRTRTLEPGT